MGKKTTNTIQEAYLLAKANLKILEQETEQSERQYINAHGIVNPDGSIPQAIYCIEEEETFMNANNTFCCAGRS